MARAVSCGAASPAHINEPPVLALAASFFSRSAWASESFFSFSAADSGGGAPLAPGGLVHRPLLSHTTAIVSVGAASRTLSVAPAASGVVASAADTARATAAARCSCLGADTRGGRRSAAAGARQVSSSAR